MRLFVHIVPAVVVAALAINALRLAQSPAATKSPISPYTVILEETVISSDKTAARGGVYTFALRSDGAISRRSETLGERPASQRTVTFPNGDRIVLDEIREMKSSTSDPRTDVNRLVRDPGSRCLRARAGAPFAQGETLVGESTFKQHRVAMVRRKDLTEYLALDLSCAILRRTVGSEQAPWNIQEAIRILPGDPDASLFDTPAAYKEVPPSVLYMLPKGAQADQRDKYYRTYRLRR